VVRDVRQHALESGYTGLVAIAYTLVASAYTER
jgi:hypothetical protein